MVLGTVTAMPMGKRVLLLFSLPIERFATGIQLASQ